MARLANCKLGCVYAYRNASGASGSVVAKQRALAAFVQFALRSQGQWTRGNDEATAEPLKWCACFVPVGA
jgi:hypothetical protein